MDSNKVILVDETDAVLGEMDKMEAHIKGQLHRAISVFIFNSRGQWLLQRRAMDKYHSGGLWTNSCCSHPAPGESTMDAANRRLREEMGMETTLYSAFSFIYRAEFDNNLIEHELDHVFVGYSNADPILNHDEAMDFTYETYQNIETGIRNNPQNYSAWFKKVANRVNDFITANNNLNPYIQKEDANKLC